MAYTVPKLKDFSPEALDRAAAALLSALEKESSSLGDDSDRKAFRDRWLARKDGVLTQINDLWLKPAPKDAKREVGQRVNNLKSEVEQKVEAALKSAPDRDRLLQFRIAQFPAEPSRSRYPGHAISRESGIKASARATAAAHTYFYSADSHHGETEAAATDSDSRQSPSQ